MTFPTEARLYVLSLRKTLALLSHSQDMMENVQQICSRVHGRITLLIGFAEKAGLWSAGMDMM